MHAKPLILDDLGTILRRRKLHIAIPMMIVLLLSGALAYLLPSIYLSTATILIEQQEIPQNIVASTVTGYAAERIEVIRNRVMTRDNLWKIAEKFDLYPDKRTEENKEEIITQMRDEQIIMTMVSADAIDPRSGKPFTATIAFTLSYENESPELAQAVTAELAELYLGENRRSRTEHTQKTSSFLNAEAQRLQKRISDLEAKVAEFKIKNAGNLPESFTTTSRSLDSAQQELGLLEAELSSLETRYSFLRSSVGSSAPLAKARADLAAAREKYSEIHPDVVRLKRTVETLEAESNQVGGSYRSGGGDRDYLMQQSELQQVAAEISAARSQRADLKRTIADYQSRLAQSPEVEREYSALTRDLDHAKSKYEEIMDKYMSAQLSEELEREQKAERFTLIEAANYPTNPIRPNIPGIMLLGLSLALGAGVGVAALAEHLDRRIFGPKDVAAIFKAPPLAIIPEISG